MRAVVLNPQGVTFDSNYPTPEPSDGEVLVRVLRAGICKTDLQLIEGYLGFTGVLGHEFVGVAEQGRFRGERVVGEINCSCAVCEYCRCGMSNHCPNRTVLGILDHDGVFADFAAVPERNLHRVPDEISLAQAVFTEPLAAAFEIPAQISLSDQQRVIVLGDGRLGNLCAQVVAQAGCRLKVIGKHEEKLALLDRQAIETALLADAKPQRRADVVIDCTGSPTGLPTALKWVKPRGSVVLKTTLPGEQSLSLAPMVIDEISLIGSRCGPFAAALQALKAGTIDVEPLITATHRLEDAVDALQQARTSSVLKLLLDVEQ